MGCDSLARSSMMTYMIVVRLSAARKLERQCDGRCFTLLLIPTVMAEIT